MLATFSGDATYAPITPSTGGFANSATLVVDSTGASTVAVTSSADPAAYGVAVTLTATVTGSLSSVPTGTIAFTASAGTLAAGCAADRYHRHGAHHLGGHVRPHPADERHRAHHDGQRLILG